MAYKQKGWSPFTKRPPKRALPDVMSANEMRMWRKMSDEKANESAKNFDYTPQTKKRRLVVDLKPQTVIDKKKK
tara:strand:- start:191 stop:412 length:222 start_codon:yes stop_codon:yes gene_type:complete